MKLYLNRASPYARLALATAHETALADRVETVWTEPWDDTPELLAVNPLAKVPALLTDDGIALIEIAWRTQSPGLAAWVDAVCARPSMQATRPR